MTEVKSNGENEITETFGEYIFGDAAMKKHLSEQTYLSLRRTIDEGDKIDPDICAEVAEAMKNWAVALGATHYTHWFQPLTGTTAGKHDAFLDFRGKDGAIMRLSGKSLLVGEPDASSFPTDGARATCAARGYTAWDPTSPAFVKEKTLFIPAVFVSYTGETLDKKAPLLKSITALNTQTKRILKLFGATCKKVFTSVGPEQEYFLVDKSVFDKREDLRLTGRTLFGAPSVKGQELDDHYFGVLRPRVAEFMQDLDETLWKYGILAKSKHNEVAPAQHELAPVFCDTNRAVDSNQLMMEIMKKVAERHNLACLLHEKPFEGVNGSGKHNNWSLSLDNGENLLDPGAHPESNVRFMFILACVIAAVDNYQGVLRACVASAANDHRLGADEAPPAIVSVYLGDELGAIVDSIVLGKNYVPKKAAKGSIGVPESPIFPIDSTDRNRTSPFAFTGNKFEFRMLGSSASVADPNIVLNTIVADAFATAADKLEGSQNIEKDIKAYTEKLLKEHYRIIFNYNGYGPEWEAEAEHRGLLNAKTTADAVPELLKKENVDVFVRRGVYTKSEAVARANIQLDTYVKHIRIEARVASDMLRKRIYPSVAAYIEKLCNSLAAKKALFAVDCTREEQLVKTLAAKEEKLLAACEALDKAVEELPSERMAAARACAHIVCPTMNELRRAADEAEKLCGADEWTLPGYVDLLYSV